MVKSSLAEVKFICCLIIDVGLWSVIVPGFLEMFFHRGQKNKLELKTACALLFWEWEVIGLIHYKNVSF